METTLKIKLMEELNNMTSHILGSRDLLTVLTLRRINRIVENEMKESTTAIKLVD